jgi:hypothetical protein
LERPTAATGIAYREFEWARRRLQRPGAALHVPELPRLPAVFVPLLALASFAEEDIQHVAAYGDDDD